MSASDPLSAEVLDLLHAACDGSLTDEQQQRLDALLAADERVARHYAQWFDMHTELYFLARTRRARSEALGTIAGGETRERAHGTQAIVTTRHDSDALRRANSTTGWRGLARDFAQQPLAVAILLLAMISGGILIWQLSSLPPQPVARQAVPQGETPPGVTGRVPDGAPVVPPDELMDRPIVAQVTRTIDADWNVTPGAHRMPAKGGSLRGGDRMLLNKGLAEIAFDNGVKVVLEGPAELTIGATGEKGEHIADPANSCLLSLGKLVAHVPQQAHGFTVQTPTMKIVDLGTEFGVFVKSEIGDRKSGNSPTSDLRPPTSTEVQVFRGLVEVQARLAQAPAQPAEPIKLKAGEGVTSNAGGQPPRKIETQPTDFVRELPAKQPLLPLATWPKDSPLMPGDIVAVTFKGMKVLKIDPASGEQKLLLQGRPYDSGQHDHGVSWHCMAVAPDGTLVVGIDGLNGKHAGVLRIDPHARTIKILASGGLLAAGQISGVAVAADGTIYAVYQAAIHAQPEHILKIDPTSGAVSSIARMEHAHGICMAGDEHDALVTADRTVTMGLLHGGTIAPWVSGHSPGRCLSSVVATNGRIFMTAEAIPDVGERKILEIARAAEHEVRTVAMLPKGQPAGIWNLGVEANGSLIVSPSENDIHIYRVDTNTGKCAVVSSGGLLEARTTVAVVPAAPVSTDPTPRK